MSSPLPPAPSPLSPLHPARPTLSPSLIATPKGDHQLPMRRCQSPHSGTCPKSNALCPGRLSLTACVPPHAAPLLDLPCDPRAANTCVTLALTPRSGLRTPHPVPTTPQYPATVGRSRAGSDSLPMLATSARTRCTFLTLHLLLERCCCPKLGLSPPVPLMSHPRGMTLPYPTPCFVFSCCAACGFPSRSRRADAAVAGSSTLLVMHAVARACRETGARCPQRPPRRHECRCADR